MGILYWKVNTREYSNPVHIPETEYKLDGKVFYWIDELNL